MRQRSSASRFLSAVVALWFGLYTAEPPGLHVCAMHSGAAAPAASQHAGHSMAGGEHHHAAAPAPQPGGDSQHHSAQCTCPDSCCATPLVAAPPAPAALSAVESLLDAVAFAAPRAIRAARAEHVLPFANGPPTRV